MNKTPITIVIPTLNAEEQLEEAILSVKDFAEEILILDSLSSDKTIDIALKYNLKVVQRQFTYYGEHFQWMVDNLPIKTDWIFLMAQDEVCSDSLKNELITLFSKNNLIYNGYQLKWRLWFMGKPLHIVQKVTRLVKMKNFHISDTLCNEQVLVDGKIGKLNGILEHKDSPSLYKWYQKQAYYAVLEAKARLIKKGSLAEKPNLFGSSVQRRMYIKKIFFSFPFRYNILYLYNLIYKGAWRDGRVGFAWAHLRSETYRMWEYTEIEMKNTGKIPKQPRAPHGDFDIRIMQTELQERLLPETVKAWKTNHPI